MLDIKLIRAEPERVKERLTARLADSAPIDAVLEADARWRAGTSEAEALQADLNRQTKASGQAIGRLTKEGKQEEAEAVKAGLRDLGDRIAALNAEAKRLEGERDAAALLHPQSAV